MANYNHLIEDWWRHLGCYDREQASGIPYVPEAVENYLKITDEWWETIPFKIKEEVYWESVNEE